MPGNPDRRSKGFHREVKSGGGRMGSSGPRNTNCMQGTRPGRRRGSPDHKNRTGNPEPGRVDCSGQVEPGFNAALEGTRRCPHCPSVLVLRFSARYEGVGYANGSSVARACRDIDGGSGLRARRTMWGMAHAVRKGFYSRACSRAGASPHRYAAYDRTRDRPRTSTARANTRSAHQLFAGTEWGCRSGGVWPIGEK